MHGVVVAVQNFTTLTLSSMEVRQSMPPHACMHERHARLRHTRACVAHTYVATRGSMQQWRQMQHGPLPLTGQNDQLWGLGSFIQHQAALWQQPDAHVAV